MARPGPRPEFDDEPQFSQYLAAIWRRKFTVLVTVLVAIGLAIGIDLSRTKIYSSTAQVAFLPQATSVSSTNNTPVLTQTQIDTDAALISGVAVKNEVARRLHAPAPAVSVSVVGSNSAALTTSAVATVTVSSRNAEFAAKAANAYVSAYLQVAERNYLRTQQQSQNTVQAQLNTIQAQIQQLTTQLGNTSSSDPATISSLSARLTGAYEQQSTLQQTLTDIQLATANSPAGQVVSQATPSSTPSSPKTLRDAGIAAGIGLILGIAIALVRERLDNRIRTADELESVTRDVAVIGHIPVMRDWNDPKRAYLISEEHSKSPPAEAYRGLRTSLQFMGLEHPIKIFQLTSPGAFEGKTTTSCNLAWTIAESGLRVILVDCDLRRPRVHSFFGLSGKDDGLTSTLLGTSAIDDVLIEAHGLPNLKILPSGRIPPNPAEMLSSARMGELLNDLAARADIVIIDSPPVLAVSDAAALAGRVQGVLLVAAAGLTTQRDVEQALTILRRVEAPLLGCILNRASELEAYAAYYQYGYGSTNGAPDPAANGRRRGRQGRHAPKSGAPESEPFAR